MWPDFSLMWTPFLSKAGRDFSVIFSKGARARYGRATAGYWSDRPVTTPRATATMPAPQDTYASSTPSTRRTGSSCGWQVKRTRASSSSGERKERGLISTPALCVSKTSAYCSGPWPAISGSTSGRDWWQAPRYCRARAEVWAAPAGSPRASGRWPPPTKATSGGAVPSPWATTTSQEHCSRGVGLENCRTASARISPTDGRVSRSGREQ